MRKLKQKFSIKNPFKSSAILILALFILSLSQATYAVTFDYTGYLYTPAFLGAIGEFADPVSGSFSFGIGETPDGTSSVLTHASGLTGFSLSVNGMTTSMQGSSTNVTIWDNNRRSIWDSDTRSFIPDDPEDRIEFLSSISGDIFTDSVGASWVPYQADFRVRYRGTPDSPPTALTSTALPQSISLAGRYPTFSDIRLAYYLEGWTGDGSERPELAQYIKLDYIGQPDLIATATAPVPEPGTLLLLSSGLTGLFFFRKKIS